MAAQIDFNRIPGKTGDPFRGQAVIRPKQEQYPDSKIKLPPIPDFRFESAYLSALRPFVTPLQSQTDTNKPEPVKEQIEEAGGVVSEVTFDYGVPIRINWPAVIWVTLRDQVIVQFVTGSVYATWAIFGTPFFKSVRVGLGNLFRSPTRSETGSSALRHLPKPRSSQVPVPRR